MAPSRYVSVVADARGAGQDARLVEHAEVGLGRIGDIVPGQKEVGDVVLHLGHRVGVGRLYVDGRKIIVPPKENAGRSWRVCISCRPDC